MATADRVWTSWTPAAVIRSAATACVVAVPLAVGIGVGHGAAVAVGSGLIYDRLSPDR